MTNIQWFSLLQHFFVVYSGRLAVNEDESCWFEMCNMESTFLCSIQKSVTSVAPVILQYAPHTSTLLFFLFSNVSQISLSVTIWSES